MLIRDQSKSPTPESKKAFLDALGVKDELYPAPWPLPNMKPCRDLDFWNYRASYCMDAEAWCGHVKVKEAEGSGNPTWANLIVYFANRNYRLGGGFAVLVYFQWGKERVEYYEWSKCRHDFHEKTIGHCMHRCTCSKCGAYFDVDTSD